MIGSKYEETKKRLKEKIKDRNICVLNEKDFESKIMNSKFLCYFCRKQIVGRVRILSDSSHKDQIDSHPIDSKCYAMAKGIEVVQK